MPESPSLDEVNLTRTPEGSGASSTPLMGRGISYVRGKWRGVSGRGPRIGMSALMDTTLSDIADDASERRKGQVDRS